VEILASSRGGKKPVKKRMLVNVESNRFFNPLLAANETISPDFIMAGSWHHLIGEFPDGYGAVTRDLLHQTREERDL
jgi:hypothetical protein